MDEKSAACPAHRTRDLSEAAALACKLRQPPTLEHGEGHFVFVFAHAKAAELSRHYWASALRLDAREYALTLRAVKDLMHRGPGHE